MRRISKIDLWAIRVGLALILIIFLKTCTTNGRVVKTENNLTQRI